MARGRSWEKAPEYQRVEDNPNLAMRPKLGALIHKVRNLSFLENDPDAVLYFLGMIAHRFFVFEKPRPEHAFKLMSKADALWNLALGSPTEANERQLESAQNAVTGDELPKSGSLPTWDELEELHEWLKKGQQVFDSRIVDAFLAPMEEHLKMDSESRSALTQMKFHKKRNDTTPGPSHKSPIAYKDKMSAGFTIPGVPGKFVWAPLGAQPPDLHGETPPDMTAVADMLARPFLGSGEAPDLNDKKLKKLVRQLLVEHQYEPFQKKGINYPTCTCGAAFDFLEEWAIHVRKLIWKELKK